jgi:hypothetical protein
MRGTRGKRLLAAAVLAAALAAGAPAAPAMEVTVVDDQLILSGPVVDGDFIRVRKALADTAITTVILRNSHGGDPDAGQRIGELLRRRGLRTAVSGFCYSACSRMFLGGRTRYFTDDYPPERTDIGFHGQYWNGLLDAGSVARSGLRAWIIRYSDGKADPALVDRWINIPVNQGLIHFFNPARISRGGVSTFICEGTEASRNAAACERVRETALDVGIVTSLDPVHSADRPPLQMAQMH